jgi:hypothetical protein
MPATTGAGVGRDLLAVPFPQMVKKLGLAISEAQLALDEASCRTAQMMSGTDYEIDTGKVDDFGDDITETIKGVKVLFGGESLSMLELGFTPTFYQFVDTIIEVKMSISMSQSMDAKISSKYAGIGMGWMSVSASSVSASFASKYQYSAEGSSLLRTKLVPVPPPAILEERIRALIEPEADDTATDTATDTTTDPAVA